MAYGPVFRKSEWPIVIFFNYYYYKLFYVPFNQIFGPWNIYLYINIFYIFYSQSQIQVTLHLIL